MHFLVSSFPVNGWPQPIVGTEWVSEVAQSSLTLCDPVDCSLPSFSRQEYWSGLPFPSPRDLPWSGLPFPSPGDLPDPGMEPESPALEADALTSEPRGKPSKCFQITWSQQGSPLNALRLHSLKKVNSEWGSQCLLAFKEHMNPLDKVLKGRFWRSRSGMGPRVCISGSQEMRVVLVPWSHVDAWGW